MLTAIVDEYVSETFVLILDDVHLINRAAPVLEFLDAWLDVQPEQITLISSGREVLEVSLAKLMAEGDRFMVIIPSHLAHGLVGDQDKIPPLSTLLVDVTLAESAYYRFVFWNSMAGTPIKNQIRSEHSLFSPPDRRPDNRR